MPDHALGENGFDSKTMRYKCRERIVHGFTDLRALTATMVDDGQREYSVWMGWRMGPPHPSWCPVLWGG